MAYMRVGTAYIIGGRYSKESEAVKEGRLIIGRPPEREGWDIVSNNGRYFYVQDDDKSVGYVYN